MGSMLIAVIALVVAMLSIQGGAAFAKQLFPAIGGSGATTLRLFFAALMLVVMRRPWRGSPLQSSQWRILIAYGISLGAMNFLFYQALGRIPLGIAVALEFTGPLLLAVFLSRRPLDGLWIILAMMGVFLLIPEVKQNFFQMKRAASLDRVGIGLALAAGACWASYIIFGRKVSLVIPSGRASALGMFIAALIFAPMGLCFKTAEIWSWDHVVTGLALGFFSSALPYSLEMYSLKKIPTRSFGILMSLEPAVAALAGMMLLHESLEPLEIVSVFLIVLASLGTMITPTQRVKAKS